MNYKLYKHLGFAWIIQFVIFGIVYAVNNQLTGEVATWHTTWFLFLVAIPITIIGFLKDKKVVNKMEVKK